MRQAHTAPALGAGMRARAMAAGDDDGVRAAESMARGEEDGVGARGGATGGGMGSTEDAERGARRRSAWGRNARGGGGGAVGVGATACIVNVDPGRWDGARGEEEGPPASVRRRASSTSISGAAGDDERRGGVCSGRGRGSGGEIDEAKCNREEDEKAGAFYKPGTFCPGSWLEPGQIVQAFVPGLITTRDKR